VTTTSLLPEVISYLVAQLQAEAVPGGALAGVTVFDGPQPSAAAQGVEQVLWVGHDPKNPAEPAGSSTQGFAFLSPSYRDESGEVTCCAKHWSGDTGFEVHREGARAIIAAVEVLLRGDPPQGGPGDSTMAGLVQWSEFTEEQLYQNLPGSGAEVVIPFKVTYFARYS
jgi:hypothetical protein